MHFVKNGQQDKKQNPVTKDLLKTDKTTLFFRVEDNVCTQTRI